MIPVLPSAAYLTAAWPREKDSVISVLDAI